MPDEERLPPPEQLQFRRAQHEFDPNARVCIMCKQTIGGEFYQANGNTACATCAAALESRQKSLPTSSMLPAVLYGGGAALAGCIIYAAVGIARFQIGIVALLVGYIVAKAILYATNGVGGRRQQILAVILTYFAISSSYVPMLLYGLYKTNPQALHAIYTVRFAVVCIELAVASPFLALFEGRNVYALISLIILFVGLRQAWVMTRRPEIIVTGPFSPETKYVL